MTTPTNEQLTKLCEEFEKWFRMESLVRNISYQDSFDGWEAGYLRAKQETEQAMKLAKFGAEIANYVDGMGAISSVAIWRIAKRVGVLTEDETEYAPNIGETIERLLK